VLFYRAVLPLSRKTFNYAAGTATAWRYVNETVALLAARAPELRQAVREAKKPGAPASSSTAPSSRRPGRRGPAPSTLADDHDRGCRPCNWG
jgi:hypothetical protein